LGDDAEILLQAIFSKNKKPSKKSGLDVLLEAIGKDETVRDSVSGELIKVTIMVMTIME